MVVEIFCFVVEFCFDFDVVILGKVFFGDIEFCYDFDVVCDGFV